MCKRNAIQTSFLLISQTFNFGRFSRSRAVLHEISHTFWIPWLFSMFTIFIITINRTLSKLYWNNMNMNFNAAKMFNSFLSVDFWFNVNSAHWNVVHLRETEYIFVLHYLCHLNASYLMRHHYHLLWHLEATAGLCKNNGLIGHDSVPKKYGQQPSETI